MFLVVEPCTCELFRVGLMDGYLKSLSVIPIHQDKRDLLQEWKIWMDNFDALACAACAGCDDVSYM